MNTSPPEFNDLSKIEEDFLIAKLQATRKAISHAGEKGRSLENEVLNLVRGFLPSEYGLSSGFVAYHDDDQSKLSKQLDIIIYDPIRCSPIARLSTCEVFPLEAVYGYIEVKASLTSSSDDARELADNSLEKCLVENKELRKMKDRRYWVPLSGSPVKAGLLKAEWQLIRSYVFAFEPQGTIANNPDSFAQRIANYSSQLGPPTHIHGVFIAGLGYFRTRPIDADVAKKEDYFHINYTKDHALAGFKSTLLHDLARFPRFQGDWSPALDQYYKEQPIWKTCKPTIESNWNLNK